MTLYTVSYAELKPLPPSRLYSRMGRGPPTCKGSATPQHPITSTRNIHNHPQDHALRKATKKKAESTIFNETSVTLKRNI